MTCDLYRTQLSCSALAVPPVLAAPAEELEPTRCCEMLRCILSIASRQVNTRFLTLPLYIDKICSYFTG